MKIRSRLFLLLAMCLSPGMLMSVCAQDSTKTTAAVEWQRYELGKGAFSALFPSKPSEEFKPSPQSEEISADMYLHFASTPNGVFGAQYVLLGEPAEKWSDNSTEFYEGVWKGLKEAFDEGMAADKNPTRTELLQKRVSTFAGRPGQELLFNLGPFKGRVLMTRTRRHAYVAIVLRSEKMELAEEDKFLNSFVLKIPEPIKTLEQ